MIGYYILIGAIALVSWLVSNKLKSKFKFYSKVHLENGMSGAEIAEKMLADHGIRDVKVVSTPGMLTDHYNPKNKTVMHLQLPLRLTNVVTQYNMQKLMSGWVFVQN